MEDRSAASLVPETLREVLGHEGVVGIATQNKEGAHLVSTWNSYLTLTEDARILYPAGGMKATEANLALDDRIQLSLGSREVKGLHGQPGAGFLVRGKGRILSSGPDYARVRERFPWARAAVEVKIGAVSQTL